MSSQPNPAAEVFGAVLRHLREQAGLSHEQVAKAISNSPYTVISWERGTRSPDKRTVLELNQLLNGDGSLEAAASRVKESRRFPAFFEDYANHESEAKSISVFATMAIPGLLQTQDYAKAVISAYCPPLDDEEIDERVSARLGRQALLTRRPPPTLGFVIQEWVLQQPLGGPQVLKDQLNHLLELSQLRHVRIQVMPTNIEAHTGGDGPMILIETGDDRRLAYIEGQGGNFWISEPNEVAVLTRRYGVLQSQAHSVRESAHRIQQLAGEL